ncbi:MAG: outer membrane lipoprotein-sorting protein, partial [Gammaproteobacteria bacterium]|nr:outer membrane lipoprotein-sorting protein [Gammaproteobacteria bacterium]
GASVRTLYFDQLREIEGRTLPMRLRVIPKDKPNESTTILYQQIHFDQPLTEQHFSLRSLKQPH